MISDVLDCLKGNENQELTPDPATVGTGRATMGAEWPLLWFVIFLMFPHSLSRPGEVLSSPASGIGEGRGLQAAVPHLHHPWGTAVVWQGGAGPGMHRYRQQGSGENKELVLLQVCGHRARGDLPTVTLWGVLGLDEVGGVTGKK